VTVKPYRLKIIGKVARMFGSSSTNKRRLGIDFTMWAGWQKSEAGFYTEYILGDSGFVFDTVHSVLPLNNPVPFLTI
jgi:hypothetical protein